VTLPSRVATTTDQPRERLRQLGVRALTTAELVTVVLGHGTGRHSARAIADALLARSDGKVTRMAALPLGVMTSLPGMGVARASALIAALELGRRLAGERLTDGLPMHSPAEVAACFAPRLIGLPVEEFHVGLLDAKHRLERDVLVSTGLLNVSLAHPREVFREAIADRAAAIVLVHNHPSGDPTPSPADRAVTAQLVEAGRILDIPVLDHVIIGRGRFLSFAEAGLL
jgi:DNA repair protein RadC